MGQETQAKTPHVLGVITARGGSKGVPRKNIRMLAGKPLIAWTIEEAKKCTLLTDTIVSTDDEDIARIAREWGADVPFLRPKELATDTTPHLPVVQHALYEMEKARGTIYDYIVILQPTSPFRRYEYIDETVKLLIEEGTDSAVTLCEIETKYSPVKAKKVEGVRVLPYCVEEVEGLRRQDFPKAYRRSGDVYAMSRDCIVKKNRLYGDSTAGHIVPIERTTDIDTESDWSMAENLAKKLGLHEQT